MTEQCTKKGCTAHATCVPRICLPAMGEPLETHKPISIIMGLPLCDAHLAAFDLQQMLTSDGRAMLRHKIAAKGKREPDFDRAFVVACAFTDPDYVIMKSTKIARTLGALAGVPPMGSA